MKTPMQELLEWVRATLPMDLDTSSEEKIKSMLEKEKNLLIKTHGNKKVYDNQIDPKIITGEQYYNETFNTKDK